MQNHSRAIGLALLTVLLIVFIWGNSCLSREDSGAQSGRITQFLRSVLDPREQIPEENFHHFVRKTAHFLEFSVLGFLVARFCAVVGSMINKRLVSLPILMVLLVAVLDEYIQFFADRGSAVTDVMLDFMGGLTGLGVGLFCTILINGRKK